MATSPIALILGVGPNVGTEAAKVFASKGYKTVLAARSMKEEDSSDDQLRIKSDFSDPESISKVFAKVKSQLGPPHVVVYNGKSSRYYL